MKKTPKIEKVSSRIRLEAYKISLTPTSGQSPVYNKSSNHHNTEESNTETENTADENTADENTADEQEKSNEQEKYPSTIISLINFLTILNSSKKFKQTSKSLIRKLFLVTFLSVDILTVTHWHYTYRSRINTIQIQKNCEQNCSILL